MFEGIIKFFKNIGKKEEKAPNSREAAKERLHLVLMQDRANVSADFLELMKQEIIDVIKKYIDIDENAIDVRLTNKENEDGTNGAPALYANIPIINIKNEARKIDKEENKQEEKKEQVSETDKNEEKEKEKEEVIETNKDKEINENDEEKIANTEEEIKQEEEIEEDKEEKQEDNKEEKQKND